MADFNELLFDTDSEDGEFLGFDESKMNPNDTTLDLSTIGDDIELTG